MIEYTSLLSNYKLYQSEYEEAALRPLRSGWYILGPELQAFESSFASYLGVNHCIGLNSGTDALILAVRALGIGPGDEVIVPAGTYIASVLGVTENGLSLLICLFSSIRYYNCRYNKPLCIAIYKSGLLSLIIQSKFLLSGATRCSNGFGNNLIRFQSYTAQW